MRNIDERLARTFSLASARHWRPLPAAIVAALSLVAASCGGSSGTATAEAADDVGIQEAWGDYVSPIQQFLGEDGFVGFGNDDELAQLERQAEEQIVACMKAEGFEYIPADHGISQAISGDEDLPYGSRAWTEVYGFGVTTQRFPESSVSPEAVGFPDEMIGDYSEEDDPNAAYLDSLSDSEREAYNAALWGDDIMFEEPPDEESSEVTTMDEYEPSGCQAIAYEEAFGGGGGGGFYEAFGDEIQELYERMESDPRVTEAEQDIEACVSEQGLDYLSATDAWEYFEPKLQAFDQGPPEGSEDWTEDEWIEWQEAQGPTGVGPALTDEQKNELAELQTEEIEMALAAYDCGGSMVAMASLYQEVLTEYETEFLDTHADEIAQYEGSEGG